MTFIAFTLLMLDLISYFVVKFTIQYSITDINFQTYKEEKKVATNQYQPLELVEQQEQSA